MVDSSKHQTAIASAGTVGGAAPSPALPSPALVRALRRLLRPLVRMGVAHQITYPLLANLLKTIYVEVADADFVLPGKAQTISRVSLLTGVHRKDVRCLREASPGDDATLPVISLGAQLVQRWTGASEFCAADGQPLALPRQARSGPSFQRLVESISKDIRPRSLLDECLRLGVVGVEELAGDERIRLDVEAFSRESDFDEKAFSLGRNLRDHIATAAHNLAGVGPPRLERSVYYDELTLESVIELRELADAKAVEALQAVNRRALVLQGQDVSKPGAGRRMNFGVYFSEDGSEDASDDTSGNTSDGAAGSDEPA